VTTVLRHVAGFGFALCLASCTDRILLTDTWDAGPDLAPPRDAYYFPPNDVGCGNTTVHPRYTARAAQLLIMLDRSSAMQSAFAGTTRENAVESALLDAISAYQSKVKFGLEQFPADSSDKAYGDCQRGSCCAGSVKAELQPQNNNYTTLSGAIECSDPQFYPCPSPTADTPSYAALEKVRDYYKSKYPLLSDDHYILLVTSSEPSCASLPDGTDLCAKALSAANELGTAGVRLFVLSVGYTPDAGSCLVRLSGIGSSQDLPDGTVSLYAPSTLKDLESTVANLAVAAAHTSCTLDSIDLPPPTPARVSVSIGQSDISQVDSTTKDGWSFLDSAHTSIVLSGTACDKWVGSKESQLSASYSCSTCGGSNACPWLQPYP
jgi:hypothetical protein